MSSVWLSSISIFDKHGLIAPKYAQAFTVIANLVGDIVALCVFDLISNIAHLLQILEGLISVAV